MKKLIFMMKMLNFNLSGFSFYQVGIEGSYINALKYGALAGLIAVFLIVAFIVLILI